MNLTLTFPSVTGVGIVRIHTTTGTGDYVVLFVNGKDETENGEMIEKVRKAIGLERFLWAMNEAIENGGKFNEATGLTRAKYLAQKQSVG